MLRVTNNILTSAFLDSISNNYNKMNDLNYQIMSGKRLRYPSDDPLAVRDSMRQKTRIGRVEQLQKNIADGLDWMGATDSTLAGVTDLLHRVRELSVQAATDTLTSHDRYKIGLEVNELLEEMVQLSNSQFKGKFIFAGTDTTTKPFQAGLGRDNGLEDLTRPMSAPLFGYPSRQIPGYYNLNDPENPLSDQVLYGVNTDNITGVTYHGDANSILREIEESYKVAINAVGSDVFTLPHHLRSKDCGIEIPGGNPSLIMGDSSITSPTMTLDAYYGAGSGIFRVNGVEIFYNTTKDTLEDLMEKINSSEAGVQATISENVNGSDRDFLVLTSEHPSMIWLEDFGGELLGDLEFTEVPGTSPHNIDEDAIDSTETIFSLLIDLRDNMFMGFRGGIENDIVDIDAAMEHILEHRAMLGARINRLEMRNEVLEDNRIQEEDLYAETVGVQIEEAIMNLKNQETMYQATMAIGARVIQGGLLDFL